MTTSKIWWGASALFVVLLSLWAFWGIHMSRVEQPKYTVVRQSDSIEVRAYPPMLVAEVLVEGPQRMAIRQGFRLLANYIFGGNQPQQKVAMTAPVQQQSVRIAMTTPVQQQATKQGWYVRFVMPASYTMATLPKPNDAQVQLRAIPQSEYVVIRFSGTATPAQLQQKTQALQAYVQQHNLKTKGQPTYAFYNPPWTLPFLRRNEIMLALT